MQGRTGGGRGRRCFAVRPVEGKDEFGGISTFHAHSLMKAIITKLHQHKET